MLNSPHPDDERLSALASGDDDAASDAALSSHVTTCDRCTGLVDELGALRASLAELPDLVPSRPLRLLPPTSEPAGDAGIAAWVRRLFAPALTAGAALAMVGLIGTASPALEGMASGQGDSGQEVTGAGGDQAAEPISDAAASEAPAAAPDEAGASAGIQQFGETDGRTAEEAASAAPFVAEDNASRATELPAERSPWPMVLFTGVALMIGAALLRWILVPRAG